MIEELKKITRYGEIKLIDDTRITIDWYQDKINQEQFERISTTIRENKPEIIYILRQLKTGAYIEEALNYAISLEYSPVSELGGEEVMLLKQLTKSSYLYIQYIENIWVVYKADYRNIWDSEELTNSKDIIKTPSLKQAINRAERYRVNYLNYIKRMEKSA